MLRFGLFPIDSKELNWHYKILKKSPIYTEQKDGRHGLYPRVRHAKKVFIIKKILILNFFRKSVKIYDY